MPDLNFFSQSCIANRSVNNSMDSDKKLLHKEFALPNQFCWERDAAVENVTFSGCKAHYTVPVVSDTFSNVSFMTLFQNLHRPNKPQIFIPQMVLKFAAKMSLFANFVEQSTDWLEATWVFSHIYKVHCSFLGERRQPFIQISEKFTPNQDLVTFWGPSDFKLLQASTDTVICPDQDFMIPLPDRTPNTVYIFHAAGFDEPQVVDCAPRTMHGIVACLENFFYPKHLIDAPSGLKCVQIFMRTKFTDSTLFKGHRGLFDTHEEQITINDGRNIAVFRDNCMHQVSQLQNYYKKLYFLKRETRV